MDKAIPAAVITQLQNLQTDNGLTLEDAVTYVRQSLVPQGYHPYPFKVDTPESFTDKLKSLVATYRYRHHVEELKEQGVDFSTYLYISEVDPVTGDIHHEREDHCHILKRIWKHTREGSNISFFFLTFLTFDLVLSTSQCLLFIKYRYYFFAFMLDIEVSQPINCNPLKSGVSSNHLHYTFMY